LAIGIKRCLSSRLISSKKVHKEVVSTVASGYNIAMPDYEQHHGDAQPMPGQPPYPPEEPRAEFSLAVDDPELQELTSAALEAIGPENLDKLIINHERFDGTVTVMHHDGSNDQITHFRLRRLLSQMPAYVANAAGAGLDADRAYALIRTAQIKTDPYFETTADIDVCASSLGKAFAYQAAHGQPLTPEDYEVLDGMLAKTAPESHAHWAADVYRSLSRIGIPTEQAVRIVKDDLKGEFWLMKPALTMLDALSVAEDIDAGQVSEACRHLAGTTSRWNEIHDDFVRLRNLIAFECPQQEIAPRDMLAAVNQRLAAGQDMSIIVRSIAIRKTKVITTAERTGEEDALLDDYEARRDRYFPEKPGELELAALPYRSGRSYEDGVRDLAKIARASGIYDKPGVGSWVFDDARGVWYSLGGITEIFNGQAVRHNYVPYPAGELSRNPKFFHSHPVAYEHKVGLTPYNGEVPPEAVPLANKLLAATPSAEDYRALAATIEDQTKGTDTVHAFIVHGTGITEYSTPLSPDRIRRLADRFNDMRNLILLQTNWHDLMGRFEGDDPGAIATLLADLETRLIQGFALTFWPEEEQETKSAYLR
jgi:hypothetical protein